MSKYETIPLIDMNNKEQTERDVIRGLIELLITYIIKQTSNLNTYWSYNYEFKDYKNLNGPETNSVTDKVRQIACEEFKLLDSKGQIDYEVDSVGCGHLSWPIIRVQYKPGGWGWQT